MNEANALRTSVYLDEETVKKCKILFGEAGVTTFSQFVRKALDYYADGLIAENHSRFLTDELKKAIHDEVGPLCSRLSKSMYRYIIELDVLSQILADLTEGDSRYTLDAMHEFANRRIAKMRGRIDLQELLNENVRGETENPW